MLWLEEGLVHICALQFHAVDAHLNEHCVANVPPSAGESRIFFEPTPGNLRLFRPGDLIHPGRIQGAKAQNPCQEESRFHLGIVPAGLVRNLEPRGSIPHAPINWEDDPLIGLIGSGKHIWADEHADEYVERLREEPA